MRRGDDEWRRKHGHASKTRALLGARGLDPLHPGHAPQALRLGVYFNARMCVYCVLKAS